MNKWSEVGSFLYGNKDISGGASAKEPACQFRRHRRCRFDSWVRKVPWSRKWQPALVFLPGKFYGQRSLEGYCPPGLKRVRYDLATKQPKTPKRGNPYNSIIFPWLVVNGPLPIIPCLLPFRLPSSLIDILYSSK